MGIFQDEEVGKKLDGAISADGHTFAVRAERDGNGDGRVYHVLFVAEDEYGAVCSGEVMIPTVPHDQGGDLTAIDGGMLYNSITGEMVQ